MVQLTRDQRSAGVQPVGVIDTRGLERAGALLTQAQQAAVGVLDPLYRMAEEGATVDARERGLARAGAHTFETGPDGQPRLPENLPSASAFFNEDRAYRQALVGRYLAESRVAANNMMTELAREHALDPDAFRAAATERVRGWLEAAPEPMRVELAPLFGQMASSTYAQLSAQRTARELASTARLAVQAHGLNVGEAQSASEQGRDPGPERERALAFIERQVALGVFTPAEAEIRRREIEVGVAAGAALRRATALGYHAGNVWLQRFEEGREQVAGAALTPDERRSIAEIARARLNVSETLRTRGRAEAERSARAEAQAMILTNRVDAARLAELERIVPGVTRQVETAIRVQGSVLAEDWSQRRTVEQAASLARRQGVQTGVDPEAPVAVQAAQARAAMQEMERAARTDAERMMRSGEIDPQRLQQMDEVIPGIARQVENAVRVRGAAAAEDLRNQQVVADGRAALARRERLGLAPGAEIDGSAPLPVQAEQARQLLREEEREVRAAAERMMRSGRIDQERLEQLDEAIPGVARQVENAVRVRQSASAEDLRNQLVVIDGLAALARRGRLGLPPGPTIDPSAPLSVQAEQARQLLREEERAVRETAERMMRSGRIDPQRLEQIEEAVPGVARQVETAVRVRESASAEDLRNRLVVIEGLAARARRERLGLSPGPEIDPAAPLPVQAEQARQVLREEERAAREAAERMIASGRVDRSELAHLETIVPGISRQVESAVRTRGNAAAEEWTNEQAVAAGAALESARAQQNLLEPPSGPFSTFIDPSAPLAVQAEQARALLKEEEKRLRAERAANEAIERVMTAMMGNGALPVDNNQTNAATVQRIATMANGGEAPDYRTPQGMAIGMRVAASGILPGPMRAELEQAALGNDPARFVAAARVYHEGTTNETRNVRVAFDRLDPKTKAALDGAWREINESGAAPVSVMADRQARFRGEVSPIEDVLDRIDRVPSRREAALLKAILDNAPSAGWLEPTAVMSGQVIALARAAILHDMLMTGRTLDQSAVAVMARMGQTGVEVRDAQGNIVASQPFAVFGPSQIGMNSPADAANPLTVVRDPPEIVLAAPYNNRERTLAWVLPELKRQVREMGGSLPEDIGLSDLRLQPIYEGGERRWRVWYRVNGLLTYVSEPGTAVPAAFDLDTPRARLLRDDAVRRVERERRRMEQRALPLTPEESVVVSP